MICVRAFLSIYYYLCDNQYSLWDDQQQLYLQPEGIINN